MAVLKFINRKDKKHRTVLARAATRCNWAIRFSNGYVANLQETLESSHDCMSRKQLTALKKALRAADHLVETLKEDLK